MFTGQKLKSEWKKRVLLFKAKNYGSEFPKSFFKTEYYYLRSYIKWFVKSQSLYYSEDRYR